MTLSRKASRRAFAATLLIIISVLMWNDLWSSRAQKAAPPPSTQKKPEAPAEKTTTQPDYSQEAVVIEQLKSTYRFERNGTGQREMFVRVKVQSEAGLERFGQLIFPYSSANENLNVDYVRVRKADGSQVDGSPADIQDLSAPLAREAPIYTDLRQKHVTVRGLRPGDSLQYHIVWTIHTPLAENHFWLEHNFVTRGVVVLSDELELNIPAASNVKLKLEPGFEPTIKEQDSRRLYSWKHANLKSEEKESEKTEKPDDQSEDPKPHVQITTFQTWDEVGQWYAALQRDRVVPDNRIKAKVEELVRGRTNDKDKIQALYEYVAKNFRYVSLSFGQGRYQPHGAAEVLSNEYGDCKDKHTLFAAMLNATGLQAYPVLINSVRKIDADVPSPAQFDHVITAIPVGGETFWADTTPEVAPFRLLAPPLRNKKALLIPLTGAAHLETTPAEPPFVGTEVVDIQGSVNEIGKLSVHSHLVLRGDSEMYFRIMFRKTPKSNWKDLSYYLSSVVGVEGNVTGIKPTEPADLEKPFEVEYDLTSENFLDWSSKKLKVEIPLPALHLRAQSPKRNSTKPIELGIPIDISYRLKLTLPAKYQARVPLALSVSRDYANYQSTYKFENSTLMVERTLHLRQHELPVERAQDYQAFVAAARSDEAQTLALETDVAGTPTIPDSIKTDDLIEAGEVALKNENYPVAEQLFRRALQNDPKEKEIRRSLAYALYSQRKLDEAIQVLREQVKINPFDDYAFGLLGRVYWQQQQYVDAEASFRKQIEIKPLDQDAHGNLGEMLVEWRKYKEAVPELEKAISINPDDEQLHVSLGRAYLSLGETKKGIAAFDEAVKIDPGQHTWNDVAYLLAVNNVELDKAQQYAESAVTAVSTQLRNVNLQNVSMDDLSDVTALIANWDTLGWVHFQKGEIDLAEKYIRAAWDLGQHSEVGYHLGRIAEKRGNTELAISMYAQSAVAFRVVPEAMENLTRLAGKDAPTRLKKAKEDLPKSPTINLGVLLPDLKETTEAEFYLSFVPDATRKAQVAEVKFISGSEKLRGVSAQLKTVRYEFVFPSDAPTKIIRRGALVCVPKPGMCSFVMVSPESIFSVN